MYKIGFDFESYKFSPQSGPSPKPVCLSFADSKHRQKVYGSCDDGYMKLIEMLVNPDFEAKRIAHNLAFDLCLIAKHLPHLLPNIFKCLEKGYFTCTVLREKLLNLATLGWITEGENNSGRYCRKVYDLATLIKERFGVDLSEDKKGGDAWRLRYSELDGIPADKYPTKAYDYSLMDSVWALKLYEDQETRRNHIIASKGFDPFDFEGRCKSKLGMSYDEFKTMISFDAGLMSAEGLRVNKPAHAETLVELEEELQESKLQLLYDQGIIARAIPEQPYSNGAKAHSDTCVNYKTKVPKKKRPECECPVKMKAAEPECMKEVVLKRHVVEEYIKGVIPVLIWSPKGKKDMEFKDKFKEYKKLGDKEALKEHLFENIGYVSLAKEFFAELVGLDLDPILTQFLHRKSLQNIKTSCKNMCLEDGITPADFVYPSFDVLKVTSRFSSYGTEMYPSLNVQQIDARMRKLVVPRLKHWFYSIDYKALEFISASSVFLILGFDSVYAKLINSGGDAHAYLGANLAYEMDPDQTFKKMCEEKGLIESDYMGKYELFMTLKKRKELTYPVKDKKGNLYTYYDYWRTFSKPVGLGIVGGMGPATLAKTAKTMFGLIITEDQAKEAKKIDLRVLPEVEGYLKYIKDKCKDWEHSRKRTKKETVRVTEEDGSISYHEEDKQYYDSRYVYTTPLGLRRPNCNFTACANGQALQSPSAEGVQVALHLILKETMTRPDSVLYKKHVLTGIIHDELVGCVKADPDIATAVINRISHLLNKGLEFVCVGVKSEVEPALSLVWSKSAYDFYDEKGRIVPYEFDDRN